MMKIRALALASALALAVSAAPAYAALAAVPVSSRLAAQDCSRAVNPPGGAWQVSNVAGGRTVTAQVLTQVPPVTGPFVNHGYITVAAGKSVFRFYPGGDVDLIWRAYPRGPLLTAIFPDTQVSCGPPPQVPGPVPTKP